MHPPDERRDLWWPSPSVELARVVHLDQPFETVHGERLERIQVSYESWGQPNAGRDNTVLVIHPLAMDCHATGEFDGQPLGWWDPLIGPGRGIDTDRYHVVCPNLLGGCYGTTGPRFPAPDGEPYLERFPLLTPLDLMRVQRLFLRALGIERPHLVIGPSMGGMVAWEWAIEAGEQVDHVAVVAAPLRTTAYQIGLNWLQRRGIELDLLDDEAAATAGQMISRGVGMLSYRAPIGLDEKFGRGWFKQPGGRLKDRGMYNVESWLRHHGRKSSKRFDPYTYLLLSRAMDLHDVGEARGGVVTALDRVQCNVLVVGIGSDQLYPAAEVHLGADILRNLGRSVAYEELRSPHGHDGFLLEIDQLAAILSRTLARRPSPVPTVAERDVRTVRLGILGAGNVARSLLHVLEERRETLKEDFALRFVVAAVAEIDPGKSLDEAFDAVELIRDPEALVRRDDVDVVVDLTRGSGSRALVEQALRRGRPVVTPNKELVRDCGDELERLALERGVRLAYHNSIAAGWPLMFSVERSLARWPARRIQALLSGACNVILEAIESGQTLEQAIATAADQGLTAPDPDLDVCGWDAAQKLSMLIARAHGVRFAVKEMAVRGLRDLQQALVREASRFELRVKLVALFVAGERAAMIGVQPCAVPADGHLGGVHGDDTLVVLNGEETGEQVYLGKGAGDLPVASAVLGDLVGVIVPARSWTGRYQPARQRQQAPRFSRFLARSPDGSPKVGDTPSVGAIPLLDSLIHPRRG